MEHHPLCMPSPPFPPREEKKGRVSLLLTALLCASLLRNPLCPMQVNGVSSDHLSSSEGEISGPVVDGTKDLVNAWEVVLNGKRVGAVEDKAELNALLNELWGPYLTADTIEAGFEPAVKIAEVQIGRGKSEGIAVIREALTANRVGETVYTVQSGDNLIGIARSYDTTVSEIVQQNPDKNLDLILVGEELVVKGPIPLLSVRTVDRRSYIDRIPVKTRRERTDELFIGEQDLSDPGRKGWAHYVAEMTFLNGEELKGMRKVLSMDPIIPSEEAVLKVGTKEPPPAVATGTFLWPTKGNITSYFGTRFIFGSTSFHSGLDVGAPNGTRIRAADGGEVIFSGEGVGANATLGNYVCIDHGNGYRTIYGHCSTLEVKEGDMVYPGQTIARVGSTGRSTGNHLHFMVKKDGSNIDPLTVLP